MSSFYKPTRKYKITPEKMKPSIEMKLKLEAEISKRREFKSISTRSMDADQLSGLERKRFIARCLIRKYNEPIYELKRYIAVRELDERSADYIIATVQEFKTKMRKL